MGIIYIIGKKYLYRRNPGDFSTDPIKESLNNLIKE